MIRGIDSNYAVGKTAGELADEQLLKLSIREPSYFAALVERHQQAFMKAAVGVVRNRQAAEDIVQEAFTKMYSNAARFKKQPGASFKSWGYKILLNTAFTHYQKTKRTGAKTEYLDSIHYDEEGVGLVAEEVDLSSASDAKTLVTEVVGQMPEHLGRLLQLYYLEDMSYRDIAKTEQISMSTLKMRLYRAKRLFKKITIETQEA